MVSLNMAVALSLLAGRPTVIKGWLFGGYRNNRPCLTRKRSGGWVRCTTYGNGALPMPGLSTVTDYSFARIVALGRLSQFNLRGLCHWTCGYSIKEQLTLQISNQNAHTESFQN